MKTENKCLPYLSLVGETYIFVGAFKDPVRKGYLVEKDFDEKSCPQLILPIESILDENYFVNSQGIVEERKPYCKHCGSKKFSRKGFNWKLRDINVKNVKRNSKLSSQNTGENSAIIPIK